MLSEAARNFIKTSKSNDAGNGEDELTFAFDNRQQPRDESATGNSELDSSNATAAIQRQRQTKMPAFRSNKANPNRSKQGKSKLSSSSSSHLLLAYITTTTIIKKIGAVHHFGGNSTNHHQQQQQQPHHTQTKELIESNRSSRTRYSLRFGTLSLLVVFASMFFSFA